MFRRTEISFESITFEIRWSNCNSMVSLARDTIEVRIIDKYWWARRGDLERWKVERIKAGWRIFSVEHKEYRERERERELRYWGLSMQAFLSTIQSNRLSSRLPRIVFLLARFRDTLSRTTLIETRVYGGFRDQKVSWHLASYPGGIYTVRHPRRGSPFDAICTDINGNPVRSFSCAISRQSARTWRRKEGARKNLRGFVRQCRKRTKGILWARLGRVCFQSKLFSFWRSTREESIIAAKLKRNAVSRMHTYATVCHLHRRSSDELRILPRRTRRPHCRAWLEPVRVSPPFHRPSLSLVTACIFPNRCSMASPFIANNTSISRYWPFCFTLLC